MDRFACAALVFCLLLTACGEGGVDEGATNLAMPTFQADVNHPHFPLARGMYSVFEGTAHGMTRRDEVSTLDTRREILGVPCTGVRQIVYLDGEVFEHTTEWYAEDQDGNVWKFGEQTFEMEDGVPVLGDDAWTADDAGAYPWIVFRATPIAGDELFGYRPDGVDHYVVESLSASAAVGAGTFDDCMRIVENADDPNDTDIILYARGVGLVQETSTNGAIELTEYGTR